jgi:rare lipoprotein A
MPVATAAAADKPGARVEGAGSGDYRFDVRKDGKAMSAAEFDAWMKARQVRIATGKPGKPMAPATPDETAMPVPVAAAEAGKGDRVVLQVASFAARANAERAQAMRQGAGNDAAALSGCEGDGQRVWRLRVGPLAATVASELAARIAGLGFGAPQRVRE